MHSSRSLASSGLRAALGALCAALGALRAALRALCAVEGALCAVVGALCAVALVLPAPARVQSGQDLTSVVEEQELLRRHLQRLERTMESLVLRLEQEGRPRALELLREGLALLAQRSDATGQLTVEELMDKAREDVAAGQVALSLQHQEAIIAHLERLLAVLLDHRDVEHLEDALKQLKQLQTGLESARTKEQELQRDTEQLREDSATPAHKALEEELARLAAAQRALLERNESAGRASGQLALEQIERELAELIAREEIDRSVLEAWHPDALGASSEATARLDEARRAAARSARLREAGEQLARAVRATRTASTPSETQQAAAALDAAAQREERHERASGDETAQQTAAALAQASETLRKAGGDAPSREQAAQALEQQAAALAQAAAEQERQAAQARAAAQDALARDPAAQASPERAAARAALERATAPQAQPDARSAEAAARATEEAAAALQRDVDDQQRLGPALAAAQNEAAATAERLRRGLEALPAPAGEREDTAKDALARAAAALQQQASSAARSQQAEQAAAQARAAEQALREAQQALAGAREARASQSSPSQTSAAQQLAQEQQQLAQDAGQARAQAAQSGSMSPAAQSQVDGALESASGAMQQAAEQLQSGRSSSAAEAQRSALDALQKALDASRKGVEPQDAAGQQRADELAARQKAIEQELLALATRNKERRNAKPNPSIAAAAGKAGEAAESLDQGQVDSAQQQEQEVEREIDRALDDLGREEQQYQKLRQEELLFRMAEEIANLIKGENAALQQVREVDLARGAEERLSRAERLRLRRVAADLNLVASRAGELATAIEAEQALVVASVLREVRQDLERVARDIDEAGGNQTGERPQALLEDALERSEWVLQALKDEQQRRQQEQQPKPPQPPAPKGKPPLVPDVTELKLLRQFEVDTLDRLARLQLVYPELETSEVSPEVLADVLRLAERHERTTRLFEQFRARLGLKSPVEEKP